MLKSNEDSRQIADFHFIKYVVIEQVNKVISVVSKKKKRHRCFQAVNKQLK